MNSKLNIADYVILFVVLASVLNLVVTHVYPFVKNMLGSKFEGFNGGCGESYGGSEGFKNM
jgi:hypothetical protein